MTVFRLALLVGTAFCFSAAGFFLAQGLGFVWLAFGGAAAFCYLLLRDLSSVDRAQAIQLSQLQARETDIKTVLQNALDAVVRMDSSGFVTEWTGQAESVFGWKRDEVVGRLLADMIIPQRHREAHAKGFARLLSSGQAQILNKRVEVEGLHRAGHEFPIELTISRISREGTDEFSAFVRDISSRRQREDEWRLSEAVFNTVDEAVIISDPSNRIIRVNPAFTQITGYSSEDVLGLNPRMLSAGTHPPGFYQELWDTLLKTGAWRGEVKNRRKNGSFYIEWLSIKRLCDSHGNLIHHVAVFSDISERKSAEAKVHRLAHHDPLTDLPNRTLFADRLRQALASAQREKQKLALLFIDLDKFKPINDTHGHHIGDLVLQEVAWRLLDGARASDTVGRLGGDEFVVLLPSVSEVSDALAVAEMIQEALDKVFNIENLSLYIESSIGVAVYPEHGSEEGDLLQNADRAMYAAKQQTGSAIFVFDPRLNNTAEKC